MPIYAVIAIGNHAQVGANIEAKISEADRLRLTADSWLVASQETTQALAETLGIRSGEAGTGVVVSVANYSGRASPNIWEWMKINLAKAPS